MPWAIQHNLGTLAALVSQQPTISAIQKFVSSGQDQGALLRELISLLEATARSSGESRRLQTEAHLGKVLKNASLLIPAYQRHLPEWCRTGAFDARRFSQIPLLKRADLQDWGTELENPHPRRAYQATGSTTTSGSTGTPIVTKGHRVSGLMMRAQQLRFQKRLGFDFEEDCAFITSPQAPGVAAPPEGAIGPSWSVGMGTGRALVLTLLADTEQQLDWLIRRDPRYLATYPSNLEALIKCGQETGKRPHRLQEIVLSSEPVSQELVNLVQMEWGARSVVTYSSSEAGLMACSRVGAESYYVEAENVFMEILRDDDSPCAPGEIGRVVITTLQDFLRPLIRYEVGDYAMVVPNDPDDPITLPRLGPIVGRERTMIRLPDGRRVWPHFEFAPLLEVGGLRKWQLVQHRDLSMTVRVVGRGEVTDVLKDRVVEVVQAALPGVKVKIDVVTDIPRTPRGKFLELVSELDASV